VPCWMSNRSTIHKCSHNNIQTVSRLQKMVVDFLDLGVSLTHFFISRLRPFVVRIDWYDSASSYARLENTYIFVSGFW
jgi:hypothetical protein